MASLQIVQTSAGQFFRVSETGSPDLAHVWNGTRVKRSAGQWIDCKNARVELIRKIGARAVQNAQVA